MDHRPSTQLRHDRDLSVFFQQSDHFVARSQKSAVQDHFLKGVDGRRSIVNSLYTLWTMDYQPSLGMPATSLHLLGCQSAAMQDHFLKGVDGWRFIVNSWYTLWTIDHRPSLGMTATSLSFSSSETTSLPEASSQLCKITS